METSSALLALCAGNSPVIGEFPPQRPVTRSFDGFFDLRLNNRLSKQSGGWWIETLSRPLWRHCNGQWWHVVIERLNETTIARKKCNTFNFLVSIVHAYDTVMPKVTNSESHMYTYRYFRSWWNCHHFIMIEVLMCLMLHMSVAGFQIMTRGQTVVRWWQRTTNCQFNHASPIMLS